MVDVGAAQWQASSSGVSKHARGAPPALVYALQVSITREVRVLPAQTGRVAVHCKAFIVASRVAEALTVQPC
jgi:hypothetical protein